jgi:hypothetical protein
MAQVMAVTGGAGMDLVIEAVGIDATVKAAIDSVRKGGNVVLVGNVSPEVTLPLQKVVTRQIRLQGSCASAGEYPKAIELMSSESIRVKPLITAIAPLEEGPRWFERLYAREPNLMKVVLAVSARVSRARWLAQARILFSLVVPANPYPRLKLKSKRWAAARSHSISTCAVKKASNIWRPQQKTLLAISTFS